MRDHFPRSNPVHMMVDSGARGNFMQVRQIAGMRGLVANPKGEIIPRPIKSNFREGLSVLEYFISTHGARKGLADTALRTADSGYLTRRLVDVSQELIVRDEDCGSTRGIWIERVGPESERTLRSSLRSRCLSEDLKLADGSVLPRNTEITDELVDTLRDDESVNRVRVRSALTCDSTIGVCSSWNQIVLFSTFLRLTSITSPGFRVFLTSGVTTASCVGSVPLSTRLAQAMSSNKSFAV